MRLGLSGILDAVLKLSTKCKLSFGSIKMLVHSAFKSSTMLFSSTRGELDIGICLLGSFGSGLCIYCPGSDAKR